MSLAAVVGAALLLAGAGEDRLPELPRGAEGEVRPPSGEPDARRASQLREEMRRWQERFERLATERAVILGRAGGPMKGDPSRIVRIAKTRDIEWPEDLLHAYVLLLDAEGRIRLAREIPVSQSGDWHLESDQLFDAAGRTVGYERRSSTFQTDCENPPVRERWALWYDAGRLLAQDHQLLDARGADVREKRCAVERAAAPIDAALDGWLRRRALAEAARAAGVRRTP